LRAELCLRRILDATGMAASREGRRTFDAESGSFRIFRPAF
jgi:hypothetical protein